MPDNITSWLGFQRLMQSLVAAWPNKSFYYSFFLCVRVCENGQYSIFCIIYQDCSHNPRMQIFHPFIMENIAWGKLL